MAEGPAQYEYTALIGGDDGPRAASRDVVEDPAGPLAVWCETEFRRPTNRSTWPRAIMLQGKLTKSCPNMVRYRAFKCSLSKFLGARSFFRRRAVLPCKPHVSLAIRVDGDVAEWSKALPC